MITLKVKSNVYAKGIAYIPAISTYIGNIIPNPKWLDDDYLCFSTGEAWFPFRMIKKSNIVSSSDYVAYNQTKNKQDNNVFQARGSKGDLYTITRNGTSWSCTCIGFGFRRDCRHINAAKKYLKNI